MNIIERPSYIPPYETRKKFTRKIRNTINKIQLKKKENCWNDVSRLQWILRNAWWGYKRYTKKR